MAESDPRSFSFVHAADLHLDTPFHGVHAIAPSVAEALREASLESFDAIIDLALQRNAAFVLVAGDVYDGAERGLRAQLRFRDGLQKLSDAEIPSFVVHGNHDPVESGWSAIGSSWPTGVTIFGTERVEAVPVRRGGTQIATVQGISYAKRVTTENLALRFARPVEPGVHVGLLHCNVLGTATGYDNYSPCSLNDLRATGLDYLALGHIHQRRILAGGPGTGDPWIVYPGNSQARSPKPGEQEAKGAMVAHVRNGIVAEVEFVACDRVRFREIECAITDIADLGDLEDQLVELARDQLESANGRSVVLRVRLSGRGPLHADLVRVSAIDELVRRLRETTGSSKRFCWWDAIVDESLPEIDREALRGRGDFPSDLLEAAGSLGKETDARRALVAELIAGAPRSLAGRLAELLGDEQLSDLIEQATTTALDELGIDAS